VILALSEINLNVNLYPFSGDDNFVFLLHGFTGSGKDWDPVIQNLDSRFNYVTIDMPGHGKSESPADVNQYSSEAVVRHLDELFSHFTRRKVIIIGYSMGGRAALSYACAKKEKVRGLILEGASAGIKDETSRKLRKADDDNLAGYIEKHTIEEFVDHWMNLDIFKSQKKIPAKLTGIRDEKLLNNKTGLANSLRGFSSGIMPVLYDVLPELQFRTLLISGENDSKYTKLNSEMTKLIPYSRHLVIKGAGHNVHVEKPDEFTAEVNLFLSSY
jgi:2-succinyl-6-hydroxy-2,4-cyclohexadiene-1-carboxylate synthase